MPTYQIPPDTRAAGTPDPAGDENNNADMIGLITRILAGFAGKPGHADPAGNAANVTAALTMANANATAPALQPSGDTTGAADFAALSALLATGVPVLLYPGVFWVNQVLQIPAGAIMTGLGGPGGSAGGGVTIKMAAGANLGAVAASSGWTGSANTFSVAPAYITGICFDGNSANQASGAGHGLVLQTYYSYIRDCQFANTLGDGLRLDYYGANGTTALSNTAVENRIVRCQCRSNGGRGINASDPSGATITDGWIKDCVVASPGADGILLGAGAGWVIQGNHIYGAIPFSGIAVSRAFTTRVTGNYVEAWGASGTSGLYGAIDLGYGNSPAQTNDSGNGSVVSGNNLDMNNTAGNSGSTIFGIGDWAASSGTAAVTITGNMITATVSLPSNSRAIALGANSAGVTTAQLYGNQVTGTWPAGNLVTAGAGTFNVNTGKATLASGTAVVSNALVTANSRILLTAQDNSSTGALRVSARTAGTSFTITSSNGADSGVVGYQICEPG